MNDNHDAQGRFAAGQGPNGAKQEGNEHKDDPKTYGSVAAGKESNLRYDSYGMPYHMAEVSRQPGILGVGSGEQAHAAVATRQSLHDANPKVRQMAAGSSGTRPAVMNKPSWGKGTGNPHGRGVPRNRR